MQNGSLTFDLFDLHLHQQLQSFVSAGTQIPKSKKSSRTRDEEIILEKQKRVPDRKHIGNIILQKCPMITYIGYITNTKLTLTNIESQVY